MDSVEYLVNRRQAVVNLPDNEGGTPLTIAFRYVYTPLSLYLFFEITDTDVNIIDGEGNTALHYAIWCQNKDNGVTNLHWACYVDDVDDVCKLLYVDGYDIDAQDNEGDTPLHKACSYGNNKAVMTLMLAGANESITNDRKLTPAQLAEHMGFCNCLLDRTCLQSVLRKKSLEKLWSVNSIIISVLQRMRRIMTSKRILLEIVQGLLINKCSISNSNRRKMRKKYRIK